ncbi:MAG: class I SAM-dependent methyltransferase [Haloarculaceae archaeon]
MDSHDVVDEWATRSGAYSPDYYAYHGPDATSERLRARLEDAVKRDARILELGCSCGRHLAHLHDDGYEDLAGIDVNPDAFDVMDEAYPDLAAAGTFHAAAIEDVVPEFDDGAFDVVFSVETLQHVHPDQSWVFAHLARVTDALLVTVENEGGANEASADDREGVADVADAERGVNYVDGEFPLYYRDWGAVFGALGMDQTDAVATKRDVLRVFEPAE